MPISVRLQQLLCLVFAHFDCIHCGSEDRVIVLDAPPELGPARTC